RQSFSRHSAYSASHERFSRPIVVGDNPFTDSPNSAVSASSKSLVDTPFRYNHGSTASSRFAFFRYGGSNSERKQRPSPARSRVFGTRTFTGPIPVRTSRSGWYPFRTTARRPAA